MVEEIRLFIDRDLNGHISVLGYPKIVYTGSCLIAASGYEFSNSRNFFFEYDSDNKRWRTLSYNHLPTQLRSLSVTMVGRQIVLHGYSTRQIFHTFIGDSNKRPIRFKSIGDLQTPSRPMVHRIITDDTDFLYAVSIWHDAGAKSVKMTVHRLVSENNWTTMYNDVFLWKVPRLDIQNDRCYLTEIMVIYDFVLYVFPINQREASINFSELIALDLRTTTGERRTENLRPGDAGFPSMYIRYEQNVALAQCPVEPWMAYLVLGNCDQRPMWTVWRLNLVEMRWCKLRCAMPAQPPLERVSVTITPSGFLYVARSDASWVADRLDRWVMVPLGFAWRAVFRVRVRVPPLEDMCLDAAMDYLRDVDPDWPRARDVRNVMRWMWTRDQQSPERGEQPASP